MATTPAAATRLAQWSAYPKTTRKSIAPYLKEPEIKELTDTEEKRKLEEIQRKHRGVRVAMAQADYEKDKWHLKSKLVQVGIAEVQFEATKVNFEAEAHNLVAARARAAIAHDNAESSVSEWSLNQQSIQAKLDGKGTQLKELQQKNLDRQSHLQYQGLLKKIELL